MSFKERLFQPVCLGGFERQMLNALFMAVTTVLTLLFTMFVLAPMVETRSILVALIVYFTPFCLVAHLLGSAVEKNDWRPRLTPYASLGIMSAMAVYMLAL